MTKILNYTTSVPAHQTIAEIEKTLAENGANKIMKDYEDGACTGITFQILTEHGLMPFKLPLKQRALKQVVKNMSEMRHKSGKLIIPRSRMDDPELAARIGWRILKDWLNAQMALYQLSMVKIEEVMLPFVVNPITGQTLYESLAEKKFKGFLLENKEGDTHGNIELDSRPS